LEGFLQYFHHIRIHLMARYCYYYCCYKNCDSRSCFQIWKHRNMIDFGAYRKSNIYPDTFHQFHYYCCCYCCLYCYYYCLTSCFLTVFYLGDFNAKVFRYLFTLTLRIDVCAQNCTFQLNVFYLNKITLYSLIWIVPLFFFTLKTTFFFKEQQRWTVSVCNKNCLKRILLSSSSSSSLFSIFSPVHFYRCSRIQYKTQSQYYYYEWFPKNYCPRWPLKSSLFREKIDNI